MSELPDAVVEFLQRPTSVGGKVNGALVDDVGALLLQLGDLTILGHLARSDRDISVTWKSASGVTGATRFALDEQGKIETVAVRWEGL